ncbi:hypothetical protein BGZ80_002090 [Entomortierella chlamydospora]|uniref:Kinesin motor domain-containing protein n=1 Tax=Entomortierella chlamydospora TaxID=101097 RepID=A0A9P6MQB1_9FUNG|nr:hypothetical protein BGZ79_010896 [Entomortierella chlamydospora]KAG0009764.1 hypothetical protein BGZ80_002090 [Entomortierella chlamydospora]
MTGQSQAQGSSAIETSVQVALRIRPVVTDTKSQNKVRQRAETEVLQLVERAPTPSLYGQSGNGAHDQPQQVAVVPLQRYFTFDQVFGTSASQDEVYQGCVKRMVDKFMEGYNVTIMAYGQTSSGKTYTMGTAAQSMESRGGSSEGIIPRAMTQLFQEARKPPPVYPGYKMPPLKTTFRVSFVEIYNEDLIDLLARGDFRPPVTIREDAKGTIYWTGVQEIIVSSVEEVLHLLSYGSQNRQTHSTEMNEKSSRSHAIFSITLRQEKFVPTHPPPPQPFEDGQNSPLNKRPHSKSLSSNGSSRPGTPTSARPVTPTTLGGSGIPTPFTSGIVAPGSKLRRQSTLMDVATHSAALQSQAHADDPEPEGEWVTLNSKFHFVDLAGSERLKRTSAIGDRAKEGISINAGLHALGNVISALGDPSKKASHVPYRDSKLTRLLQDSLGGNALALMIACVSPIELNLGETLNTLKYANRARNIKNSSSLNQEINMDNPEYLRSIIQKLKLEIKMLKEAKANGGAGFDDSSRTMSPDIGGSRTLNSNRHSIASASTIHGNFDDSMSEDRAFSPSPTRRLNHYQSRDSISTEFSHSNLDAVQEEEDRYSDTSSAVLTTVVGTGASTANGATATTSPITRSNIVPLIPASLDPQNFREFVEPVIEEYEKVISGLESHLAMTKAALSHSEQAIEDQQGIIDRLKKQRQLKLSSGSDSDEASSRSKQKEFESQLQALQAQLKDVEAQRIQGDQHIHELEQKLAQEHAAAEETQKALKDKEMLLLELQANSSAQSHALKEQELNALTEKIAQLEEQYRRQLEEAEAEAEVFRLAKAARASTPESDQDRGEWEANEAKREEELIERLQAKATLEEEIEQEKTRRANLVAVVESSKLSHFRTDSAHDDSLIKQLDIPRSPMVDDAAQSSRIKELEEQLAQARESERLLKAETISLSEKLENLRKAHGAALEMEEMLHKTIGDLEQKLKSSQEVESKRQVDLEQSLARIQDLEERSTKAEQEALALAEELKSKLAEAKAGAEERSGAEERLTDELIELLEKMDQERAKVETLQAQVENHLADLEAERSRAAELEADRDAIQAQWNVDKERLQSLEKDIQEHSALVLEKAQLIASLEEKVSQHEGTHAMKLQLEQELEQRVNEHADALSSKAALILELEQKVQSLEESLKNYDESANETVSKIQAELSEALEQLSVSQTKEQEALEQLSVSQTKVQETLEQLNVSQVKVQETLEQLNVSQAKEQEALEQLSVSQTKVQEQETILEELNEKVSTLDIEASAAKDILSDKEAEHAESIQALEIKLKLAETDRDDAETKLEEVERRHQAVNDEIMTLQINITQHLATIEILQNKLSEAQSPPSSRPVSMSSSAVSFGQNEDSSSTIQKLEKEKARYRALVRENEKEIERLSQDLESLASEFSNAATVFEDAEEEMKARITELEALLEDKNLNKPNNSSTLSLASSIASNHSARSRDPSSLGAVKAQLTLLKTERDQAVKSSEELSSIVAELNEKNHSLQERLLSLEREQESLKLQHVLDRQSQQEELRILRDRAERLDRGVSPSPMGFHPNDEDKERSIGMHERILRHKTSSSSDHFANRGEDSLATPRQSWSTTASASQQPGGAQTPRAGRHESTIIQQAKHIKLLEERIAELQGSGGSPMSPLSPTGEGNGNKLTSSVSAIGLGIQRKNSDSDLARPSLLMRHHSSERVSPALRAFPTLSASSPAPPTPPPSAPLPPPPPSAGATAKITPAHLQGNAPPSPRIGGVINFETSSPSSPSMRPSRTGSVNSRLGNGRRERDSTSSNMSEAISPATAQALEGVEVNELRGVVDTLAHQVQALKIEQTMQQGKIQRLEAALAEAEEKLKNAQNERAMTSTEKESLAKDLEQARTELDAAKAKAEKDRAGLQELVDRERKEKEKAVEVKIIMETKMEELMSRKSKFGCF